MLDFCSLKIMESQLMYYVTDIAELHITNKGVFYMTFLGQEELLNSAHLLFKYHVTGIPGLHAE